MIVVMAKGAMPEQIENVQERIRERGFVPHVSPGVEQTVIGVLGQPFPELQDELELLPGVAEVHRITKPYKLCSREFHGDSTVVKVGGVEIGGSNLVVMAGPCSVEDYDQVMSTAHAVKESGASVLRGGAFKPRTSPYSFRGMGVPGLRLLAQAGQETGLPIITEVMTPEDVEIVAEYADILQVGARNMQNYNLLERVGYTQKPIMLKRGLSATYEEWLLAAEYILSSGNDQVILCERGIRTFETSTRFTLDLSAVPAIQRLSHLPVVADPSHSSGKWYLVAPLALGAVAAGAHGLMIEVHPNPDAAKCDGPESLTFENFRKLMDKVREVASAVGKSPAGVLT